MTSRPLVIRGGLVPSTAQPDGARCDVEVIDGVITHVGAAEPAHRWLTHDVLDAGDRVLLPGFVDVHTHADARAGDPDVQLALLRQGVTTVFAGLDGLGFAPADESDYDALGFAADYFRAINGPPRSESALSVAGYLAQLHALPVRVETFVPHGLVRYAVLGAEQRPAEVAERQRMRVIVERAFDHGARGFSTGLEYAPGGYADVTELVELCAAAAERGLPHVTHMRGYEDRATEAFAEIAEISARSGVAAHISHLHGPLAPILAMLDGAASAGLDVTFDSYPYRHGASILAMLALPAWLPLADRDATLVQLSRPEVVARVHEHVVGRIAILAPAVLSSVPGHEEFEGSTLAEVAATWAVEVPDAVIEVLVRTGLRAGCVFEQPPTNTEESVRALANHPGHMAGSDSIYIGSHPHPRGWGTFPRFLHRHLRQWQDWTWADAAEHLSTRASERFRLTDRGVIAPGYSADLVLLDPETVADRATFAAPTRPADGIADVLVRGEHVLRAGRLTTTTGDDR
ncbi:N-acyl-D-amino-acid deacylase family protein [Ruania halotolerans]|uniref:N-acyl-D-amino-acid deacylase family protein n=1 Tax=Ruania halotolerans TaxID=2897773 RepID=UPI001E59DC10|nr:amidohydrolase family protein [Ruania halotolerans]UFU05462.1 amidohydrolase family protein [Ruania halotolerans]